LLESLALILGDLSPTSASAHMNYLIKLLKSCFAVRLLWKQPGCRWLGLPQRGRRILRIPWCLSIAVFLASEASDTTCSNLLTNQGFYTLFTAGNAWRPRQRMRTLRIRW